MKMIFQLFSFCFLLNFISCGEDDLHSFNPEQLQGKWNWVSSVGGIGGWTQTPESTGQDIQLEIQNGIFKQFTNGTLTLETTYTLEEAESIFTGETEDMIFLSSEFQIQYSFILENDRLVLKEECYDCFVSEFVKE